MDCPRCGTSNPPGARFCLGCGSPLTPPQLPEGERRFVTVLFADVVGSTAMGEELDPEQIAEIMNGAFALFNGAITQYGGTVARLMGDAVLAIFGAPVAHEDDAERAVNAGLAIQAAAAEYARAVEESHGVPFNVRVGIHSGLAVLTMVGDEVKTEYTAMGDTANVAARLQSSADPDTVLISADTQHLIRNIFDLVSRGPIAVKGKSLPVMAYEVAGVRATRGKLRGLEGISSPLVGRDSELQIVRQAAERAAGGHGEILAVTGEAGLGKSRLAAEARNWVATAHPEMAWLEGRALSYGQTIPYYPWRQVIRQAIGASETDLAPAVRDRLVQTCDQLGIPDTLPFLEVMLQVESDATRDRVQGLEGSVLVEHVTETARTFLRALCLGAPTVVLFDDLHWADEASLQLLAQTTSLLEESRLLLLCLTRPEKRSESQRTLDRIHQQTGDRFTGISLEPLPADTAGELLGNLLHVEDLPDTVHALILRKSDGNPFFLEEVIRSLVDSGHIVRENGRWRATKEIVDVAIPDTLAGVLSARIDRLPETTKRVAQTAAVIGRIFPYPVLTAACAEAPPPERVDDPGPHLSTLTAEELVRERRHDPELEYIFKHALTQEAAYDLLLLRRRKAYHRRIAEVIEGLYGDRLDDFAAILAHHAWLGEDWPRAARYATQAGAAALKVYARHEALDHYERAYTALKKMPDASPTAIVDAILTAAPLAAFNRWGYEQSLERLTEAETLARESEDTERLASALNWIGNVHLSAGYPSRAWPHLAESFRLSEEVGDDRLTMLPTFVMTMMMVDRDPRGALGLLDSVVTLASGNHNNGILGHALAIKALAHARLGEFATAERTVHEALDVVSSANSPVREVDALSMAALSYLDMGDVKRGQEYAERAAERATVIEGSECSVYAMYCVGMGSLRGGDWSEAQAAFEEASRRSEVLTNDVLKTLTHGGLAMAQSLSGRDDAVSNLEHILEQARSFGDEYTTAVLGRALGETYMRTGDLGSAEGHLNAALEYFRRNEMRPYMVQTLRTMETLYVRQGRDGDAQIASEEADRLQAQLAMNSSAPANAGDRTGSTSR